MSKSDTMVAYNRKISEAKIKLAKQCMRKMFDEGERVTIPKLVAKTNLSKGFFYKNPEVRCELDRIQEQQVGLTNPRSVVRQIKRSLNRQIKST